MGIGVINGMLVEVNVMSQGHYIHESNRIQNACSGKIIDFVEDKVEQRLWHSKEKKAAHQHVDEA